MPICKYCKASGTKEEMYFAKKNHYYCDIDCCNKHNYRKNAKQHNVSSSEYDELIQYIDTYVYKGNTNFPFIGSQIKRFKNDFDFRYKGMLLTLQYYFEILEQQADLEYGLAGIIPRYYFKAREHYVKNLNLKKQFDAYDSEDMYITVTNTGDIHKAKMILEDIENL